MVTAAAIAPAEPLKTYASTIAESDFIIKIGNQRFSFSLGTQKGRLLKELVKNKGAETLFDDVISELDTAAKIGATPKDKEKCYNLCRGLKNTFAAKGIRDFLEFNYNGVAVSKAYQLVKW